MFTSLTVSWHVIPSRGESLVRVQSPKMKSTNPCKHNREELELPARVQSQGMTFNCTDSALNSVSCPWIVCHYRGLIQQQKWTAAKCFASLQASMMSCSLVARNRCCVCGRHNPGQTCLGSLSGVLHCAHTQTRIHISLQQGQLVHIKQESQLSGVELNVCRWK